MLVLEWCVSEKEKPADIHFWITVPRAETGETLLTCFTCLPVQKHLLTGIWITEPSAGSGDETLLTCFTSTKALAYWYKSTCLLVQKHLLACTKVLSYWYKSTCLERQPPRPVEL